MFSHVYRKSKFSLLHTHTMRGLSLSLSLPLSSFTRFIVKKLLRSEKAARTVFGRKKDSEKYQTVPSCYLARSVIDLERKMLENFERHHLKKKRAKIRELSEWLAGAYCMANCTTVLMFLS